MWGIKSVGSGDFYNVYGVNGFHLTAGGNDYAERSVQMVKGVQDYYRQAGVTPGVPNQQGQHANPYISGVAYPNVPLGDYSVPKGWPGVLDRRQRGDVFGPPVSFLREAPQEAKAGVGFKSDRTYEGDWFYFHTDHLGSTSYLTDTAGNVSQFVWYAPYGEALVDEHTTTYENPFKFSGKELDDITGLYDHGARNRNPITAVWYGIDELFENDPNKSPYHYCGGNPVRFVDPDGRDFKHISEAPKKVQDRAKNLPADNADNKDSDMQLFRDMGESLIKHNVGKSYKALDDTKDVTIYVVLNHSGTTQYDPRDNVLYIDPESAQVTDIGVIMPPIVQLGHELKHAYDRNIRPVWWWQALITDAVVYKDAPDITEDTAIAAEIQVCKAFGFKLSEGGKTRKNYHGGSRINVKNPYSIK